MQKYLYKYYFKVNFYVEYVFVLRNHYYKHYNLQFIQSICLSTENT